MRWDYDQTITLVISIQGRKGKNKFSLSYFSWPGLISVPLIILRFATDPQPNDAWWPQNSRRWSECYSWTKEESEVTREGNSICSFLHFIFDRLPLSTVTPDGPCLFVCMVWTGSTPNCDLLCHEWFPEWNLEKHIHYPCHVVSF